MTKSIWRIPIIYAFLGVLWILLSDRVTDWLFEDSEVRSYTFFQSAKGIFFVLATAFVLYFLIKGFYNQLISSEEEYRKLFDRHPNPMWIYDPETLRFLSVNYAAIQSYGYTEKEFLSMTIADIRPKNEITALLKNITADGRDYQASDVWKHKRKSGEEFYVDIFSSLVFHQGEKARLVTAIDVDQSRKAKFQKDIMNRQLIETGNYLRSLIDSHSSFLIRMDLQGNLTFGNRQFLKDFGIDQQTVRKSSYSEVFHNEDWRAFQRLLIECKRNPGEVNSITLRSMTNTQTVIFTDWEFVGIGDIHGNTIEVQGVGKDVSDKVGSLQKLENYKEYFSRILSSLNDVVISLKADDFSLLFTNDTCKMVTGYTAGELLQDPDRWKELIHEADEEEIEATLLKAKNSGREIRIECKIKTKQGDIKTISCRLKKFFNEKESRNELHGVYTDVTEMKTVQIKMREYAERVEEILESITAGFFTVDKGLNFDYLNKGFENHTGYRKKNWIGKNLWEAFPVDDKYNFSVNFQSALETGHKCSFEAYHPDFDKWLRLSAYPKNEGLAVYFEDISVAKKAREEIQHSRKLLDKVINNTPDMIWSVDRNLKLITANKTFLNQTRNHLQVGQYVLSELVGTSSKLTRWKEYYLRALSGENFIQEEIIATRSGEQQYAEISFTSQLDEDGKVVGVNCFGRNTTHHRKLKQQLMEQNEKLQEIAHIQSHVVRNPVVNIQGLLKLLDKTDLTASNNREILYHMETSIKELDEIIHEIVKKATNVSKETRKFEVFKE